MFSGSRTISECCPRYYMLDMTGFATHYDPYFLEAVDCNSDPLLLSYFSLLQYPTSSYSSVSATHYYY
ncbi:hypothetical protein BDR03DRAFT_951559 [Suillus americanus]|nr:hypothetical protein BDR03DRAFT_951559 [Suillus americanus]